MSDQGISGQNRWTPQFDERLAQIDDEVTKLQEERDMVLKMKQIATAGAPSAAPVDAPGSGAKAAPKEPATTSTDASTAAGSLKEASPRVPEARKSKGTKKPSTKTKTAAKSAKREQLRDVVIRVVLDAGGEPQSVREVREGVQQQRGWKDVSENGVRVALAKAAVEDKNQIERIDQGRSRFYAPVKTESSAAAAAQPAKASA